MPRHTASKPLPVEDENTPPRSDVDNETDADPSSDEEPDSSDADDFAASSTAKRRRAAAGPTRKATRIPKEKASAAGNAEESDEHESDLMELVQSNPSGIEMALVEWVESYTKDRNIALKELLEFLILVCVQHRPMPVLSRNIRPNHY